MNWNGARILEWVREEFPLAADRKESGCSDVHLALADLFWLYGIDYAGVQEISANTQIAARAIVLPNASVGARRLGSGDRADAPPPLRNLRSLSRRGSQVPPATPAQARAIRWTRVPSTKPSPPSWRDRGVTSQTTPGPCPTSFSTAPSGWARRTSLTRSTPSSVADGATWQHGFPVLLSARPEDRGVYLSA
jgi:hypothetical protein